MDGWMNRWIDKFSIGLSCTQHKKKDLEECLENSKAWISKGVIIQIHGLSLVYDLK